MNNKNDIKFDFLQDNNLLNNQNNSFGNNVNEISDLEAYPYGSLVDSEKDEEEEESENSDNF